MSERITATDIDVRWPWLVALGMGLIALSIVAWVDAVAFTVASAIVIGGTLAAGGGVSHGEFPGCRTSTQRGARPVQRHFVCNRRLTCKEERGSTVQHNSGVITASVFAMLLAGVVSGGVVGLLLGSVVTSQIAVAFICAFIGAVLALVIGRAILDRNAQFALPSGIMFLNVIIALWLGALAGHELSVDIRDPPATPLVGALSGVLAAVMIVSVMITIYTLRNHRSALKS